MTCSDLTARFVERSLGGLSNRECKHAPLIEGMKRTQGAAYSTDRRRPDTCAGEKPESATAVTQKGFRIEFKKLAKGEN